MIKNQKVHKIYPGKDGKSTLSEDDGKTFDYRKGEWMRMEMEWRDAGRRLALLLARGSRMLPPSRRTIEVRVAGDEAKRTVVFQGRPMEVRL